jgi:hypothetical protein
VNLTVALFQKFEVILFTLSRHHKVLSNGIKAKSLDLGLTAKGSRCRGVEVVYPLMWSPPKKLKEESSRPLKI